MNHPEGLINEQRRIVEPVVFDYETLLTPEQLRDLTPEIRTHGRFSGRGFYLPFNLDWTIVKDEDGVDVLVPTTR